MWDSFVSNKFVGTSGCSVCILVDRFACSSINFEFPLPGQAVPVDHYLDSSSLSLSHHRFGVDALREGSSTDRSGGRPS